MDAESEGWSASEKCQAALISSMLLLVKAER